jgi:PAS domain S-box-containing protein
MSKGSHRSLSESVQQLPVGVYLVSPSGEIWDCNRRARSILGIPTDDDLSSYNLSNFYLELEERERLMREVDESDKAGLPPKQYLVDLCVAGRQITVRMECSPWRENGSEVVKGYIGCITEIPPEERYRQLLDLLKEGVFQTDGNNTLVFVNKATSSLFGYDHPRDMVGLSLTELFFGQESGEISKVISPPEGTGHEDVWEMKGTDGTAFFAAIRAYPIERPNVQQYLGMKGTVRDVSVLEHYKRLFDGIPIGYYLVLYRDDEEIFYSCNREFARMFDFENEDQVIGMRVENLHGSVSRLEEFRRELIEADQQGRPLIRRMALISSKGKKFIAEISSRVVRNHSGESIGRVGAVRDISKEERLLMQVQDLTNDIGAVLHSFSSTIEMLRMAVHTVNDTLRSAPDAAQESDLKHLSTLPVQRAPQLAKRIMQLVGLLQEAEWHSTAFDDDQKTRLQVLAAQLQEPTGLSTHLEHRIPALRRAANEVRKILESVKKHTLPREITRGVVNEAWAIERLCSMSNTARMKTAVLEMTQQVLLLREFITLPERTDDAGVPVEVNDLVARAVEAVIPYAENRVQIKQRVLPRKSYVSGSDRDLLRAVTNLLHNAVKYSWEKDKEELPWVDVRVEVDRSLVVFEVENFGVPIDQDELAEGTIFRLGYRGRFAADRRRAGTGVGLTDSKRVIESHRGTLILRSGPARSGGKADDYNQPFVTVARVTLPLSH